jgi:hypothetical protein
MISREAEMELKVLATQFKAVTVVGPRQSGKTTLVRKIFRDKPYAIWRIRTYADLPLKIPGDKLTGAEGGFVVYGGDILQKRNNGIAVVPYNELKVISYLR